MLSHQDIDSQRLVINYLLLCCCSCWCCW